MQGSNHCPKWPQHDGRLYPYRAFGQSMNNFIRGFAGLLMVLALAGASAQALYKSIGPDGKVQYSDRPAGDGRIEKTMAIENLPSSQVPGLTHSYVEQLRDLKAWESEHARKNPAPPSVPSRAGTVLYSAAWCGYCKLAKAYMQQKGIGYQEIDIDTPSGKAEYVQARTGRGGIPLLVVSGKRLEGFTPAGYESFFASLK